MDEKLKDWAISSRAPQRSEDQAKVQRLAARRRVKQPEVPSPSIEGEDIVQSAVKAVAAKAGSGIANHC